ncbi:pitrilysin family protein [Fulvivirga sp. M361]|uniref:M16 family metallopeptidase n=1 Tax=Fulvivirga sp. M361 TaxID=2594266 RepID=UPI001629E6CE|nr:M16 family metallopeptidase [Fulvivirga sp. M361]
MKKLKLTWVLCVFGTLTLTAQERPQLLDPDIRYGVLENGMTYYILHNEEPKDRASFYLVQNVGAILEEDHQNGLAHMLEHLAFNGSDNFKGKGVKDFLERQGVQFGKNINAYTNTDETVYNFSNVPTGNPDVMDSCVLILHDWSGSLTLAGEEIDAERGVIKEEWRTRNNAGRRMSKKLAPITYYESKYAIRDVIGDMDVVENSPYSAIRSFYKKWYRPDLQAVVIVGDFDSDKMEERVKRILSGIGAPNDPAKRLEYPVGDNEGIIYDFATDEEAQYVQFTIMIKHPTTKRENRDIDYLRDDLLTSLHRSIMAERLNNIQQKPHTPFKGAQIGYYNFVRTSDVFYMGGAKPDHKDVLGAMKALLIENERVKRHGFTPTELERAKIKMLTAYEEAFKNRKEVSNDRLARSIQNHYLVGEPKPGVAFELDFVKNELPKITVGEVGILAKKWSTEDNVTVKITGPKNVDFEYPSKEQIEGIFKEVKKEPVEVFVDHVVSSPLVANELTPGKTVATATLNGLEAKEYTLSNGAKVVVYPTDKNENQILFNAYSRGGMSLLADDALPTASATAQIADESGIGEHNLENLKKLLVGKQVSIWARISQFSEGLNGSSTPKDIETLMKLIYLTFEAPRFDRESYETVVANMKLRLKNAATNPQKIMRDSILVTMSGDNLSRRPIQSLEFVDNIAFEKVEGIYRDRISNAGDFVFAFVGAIDEASFIPLVEKYIGAISDNGRREHWKDDGVRPHGNGYIKMFSQPMEVSKQTNFIKYQGEAKYSRESAMVLAIAKGILSQRYFETIREQEGGSYGVSVYNSFSSIPYDSYSLTMYFDCNPDKADKLVGIIHAEMKNLLDNGPKEEDYKKAVEEMIKSREQSLEQNNTFLSGIINQYQIGYNTALSENYETILNKMTIEKFTKKLRDIMNTSNTVSVIMKPE